MPELDPADLAARLKELDSDFADAPIEDDDPFALPPPGIYQCILDRIDYFESHAGDPFLKWVFVVKLDPVYAEREISLIYNLGASGTAEDRKRRLGFLKRDLAKLGVNPEEEGFSLSDLHPGSPVWDKVLDAPCVIAVVDSKKTNPSTGKPYRNAYLNERLGAPLQESDVPSDLPVGAAVPSVADDDIPFAPSVL